jgi:arylsulfatase A-like enzyme
MLMTSRIAVVEEPGPDAVSSEVESQDRPTLVGFLALSGWCGLIAGLLEVGATVLRKETYDLNRLYWLSRHFVWLVPLIDLMLFLASGAVLWILARYAGARGAWLARRLLCALTLLPVFMATFPRIYSVAWFIVALGLASRLVPVFERHSSQFGLLVRLSFPVAAALLPILAGSLWGSDWLKARREQDRALPRQGSPNVLLVVLDTVGASHLSSHGYGRPTSPTLDELAARGIRFDRARATSSWTLPSHASMFTGRWPHELSAGWFTPLDGTVTTLAEFLGARGFATAGFIANSWYCASDSGLARGFTVYQDHAFPRLTAFKTAVLVDRFIEGTLAMERFLETWLEFDLFRPVVDHLWRHLKLNRKESAALNREFLTWLSQRKEPQRPFFAFLNYYDAHYPYEIPESGIRRFGSRPRNNREANWMRDWLLLVQSGPSEHQVRFARDSYDDCIANLDEQLGCLIDELERRAVLERTWVIVTSDHGESFGEQPGIFWHGTSLYQPQLHVPLLIIPPSGGPQPRRITETVSLRDLPATIVDLLGFASVSPFRGVSLARFWDRPTVAGPSHVADLNQALSEVVPLGAFDPDPAQWLKKPRWPSAALTEGDWTYIRRGPDSSEELFRADSDDKQLYNLAGVPAVQSTLTRLRSTMDRLTSGPLTPKRFNP